MRIRLVNPLEALFIFLDKAKEMPIIGTPLVRASTGSDASHIEALAAYLTKNRSAYLSGLDNSASRLYRNKLEEYQRLTGGGQ